uniref:BZIP domain-containing protein n=1 Tax=Glossina pallidipes TaxID=7398 RepID=A0A1A9ZLI9_GLOPL
MMLQDKLISGQFLLDFRNEHSGLLQTSTNVHQQPANGLHLHQNLSQSPSSPFAALDIYSAYAYQQQIHQKLLNTTATANLLHQSTISSSNAGEVLDLSRRCDLTVETTTTTATTTPRKTPSPYQNSSHPTSRMDTPPSDSPNTAQKLLYKPVTPVSHTSAPNDGAISMYPKLSYGGSIKSESVALTPPPALATTTVATAPKFAVNTGLLQTFATATVATDSLKGEESTIQQNHSSSSPYNGSYAGSLANLDNNKNTRPFKAYPRDPLVVAANFAATDVLLDNPRVESYTEYRKRVLEHIRRSNGGSDTISNPKMRRTNSRSFSLTEDTFSNASENDERSINMEDMSDSDSNSGRTKTNDTTTNADISSSKNPNLVNSTTQVKDAAYYERRRKNNAAAKKSRDRRRRKEDEIAIFANYLERENIQLRAQIQALKAQLALLPQNMPLDV